MKVLIYRINSKKRIPRQNKKLDIEKILFVSVLVTFILLIVVQGALLDPAVRTFLAIDEQYEGTPLAEEEFLYNEGVLYLRTADLKEHRNVKVLVNGDEVARFDEARLQITVRNGDVIEIDGTDAHGTVEVVVESGSENISQNCLNARVKVTSEVKKLVRVKLE
ncbi:MAG TPA: hypothetical protein GXX36_12610 [Clostridiaceae bacterium]|nr:hypothetical protein [Clostridiaceae bacterium]